MTVQFGATDPARRLVAVGEAGGCEVAVQRNQWRRLWAVHRDERGGDCLLGVWSAVVDAHTDGEGAPLDGVRKESNPPDKSEVSRAA